MNITLRINNKSYTLDAPEDMPLLWVLRDLLGLTGTKYGCGIGACGSCMVLIDNNAIQSCITPAKSVQGQEITTIEGLSEAATHPVQIAWIKEQVPQCGYCQSGQIITAVSLLKKAAAPSSTEINNEMSKVLCRCGSYPRVKKAIQLASKLIANEKQHR